MLERKWRSNAFIMFRCDVNGLISNSGGHTTDLAILVVCHKKRQASFEHDSLLCAVIVLKSHVSAIYLNIALSALFPWIVA